MKRKHGVSVILGPCNSGHPSGGDTATPPSRILRALHTHTVCHFSVKRNGTLTYNHSSIVIPPSTAFQIADVGLGCNWYASLFCQPMTTQKRPDSVNDINTLTQYGPVTDEQAAIPAKCTWVSPPPIGLDQCNQSSETSASHG